MSNRLFTIGLLTASFVAPLFAAHSDRSDDVARIQRATEVFNEIQKTPDKGIPQEILAGAQCIAIIPGQKKFALGFGGQYGKGLATCRHLRSWSAPAFIAVGGGSWGLQIGGESADVVMVFKSMDGLRSLLSNKFKIGADAAAAAGPVGRHADASTDVAFHSEILTYSRSRGAFAGISLNGSVVQPDDSGNRSMYGDRTWESVLEGRVAAPAVARPLIRDLSRYEARLSANKNANKQMKKANKTAKSNY